MKKFMNKKRLALGNSQGFTLIEVVLVLAIGGLIFLLAFVAFQQVSRNRRDTQRRTDAARLISEIQNYSADNNSAAPAASTALASNACTTGGAAGSFQAFLWTYICGGSVDGFKTPNNTNYTVVASHATNDPTATDAIMFTPGANCDGGSTGNRVKIKLEAGVVCRDDQ